MLHPRPRWPLVLLVLFALPFLPAVVEHHQAGAMEAVGSVSLPTNGRIAFAHFRDANYSWDIRSIDPSGKNDTWLSEDRARYEVGPRFSPDGTKIAYEFQYDIMVMNVDGSGRHVLIGDASANYEWDVSWSPDGQTVAFMSDRASDYQLFTMPADGSVEPTLVSVGITGVDLDGYGWAPDGSALVFSGWDGGSQTQKLYRAAPDGSGPVAIPTAASWPSSPSWSSDGSRLTFINEEHVWVSDADGTNAFDLTPNVTSLSSPAWSPVGDRILFLRGFADWKALGVMDTDGSNSHYLLIGAPAQSPRWSPDGTRIVFRGAMDRGEGEIYTISAAGGTAKRLTDNKVDDRDPDWGAGCSIRGTAGDDTLERTGARDFICGAGGNDIVYGMGGNDVLLGGPGNDHLFGGGGGDIVAGETGDDRLNGGAGDDTVNGQDGVTGEPVVGGTGTDRCRKDTRDSATGCESYEHPI